MHSKDLRAKGETEQRLYGLDAWREAPYYTDREQAALAWAESVTNVQEGHIPDEVFEQVRQHFSEEELIERRLSKIGSLFLCLACTYYTPKNSNYDRKKLPGAIFVELYR